MQQCSCSPNANGLSKLQFQIYFNGSKTVKLSWVKTKRIASVGLAHKKKNFPRVSWDTQIHCYYSTQHMVILYYTPGFRLQCFHPSMTQKNKSNTLNVNYNLFTIPNQLMNSRLLVLFFCFFLGGGAKNIKQCCICSGQWDTKYVLKDKCRPTTYFVKRESERAKHI